MTRYEELVALRQSGRLVTGISYDLNNAGAGLRGYVHFLSANKTISGDINTRSASKVRQRFVECDSGQFIAYCQ